MKPVALVFNGLKHLQPRGISRYTTEIVSLLEERSFDVREVVIPSWLFRGTRGWKIAVLIAYQQLVMPLLALRYRPALTVDPYNGFPVLVALLSPTVGVIHDFIPFQRRRWWLRPGTLYQRLLHKLAPCMPRLVLAFISDEVAEEARAYVHARRTCLLPNLIKPLPIADDEAWRTSPQARVVEAARARGDVVVTTISGDGAHKDYPGLVRMLGDLGVGLTLVAFGFAEDAPLQARASHGAATSISTVRFGPCDASVIGRAIRDSDVFAFHSLQEGFGRPICEALFCGTPVVSAVVPAVASLSEAARMTVFPYRTEAEFNAAFSAARRSRRSIPAQVLRRPAETYLDDLLASVLGTAPVANASAGRR